MLNTPDRIHAWLFGTFGRVFHGLATQYLTDTAPEPKDREVSGLAKYTMRVRSQFRGQEVDAWKLSQRDWDSIRIHSKKGGTDIRMLCCGGRGVPKLSPLGRRFFAHFRRPKTCVWAPESELHIDLKYDAVRAVEDAGWTADYEFPEADWQADVLASRGRARVAVEIQISKQGQSKTEQRDIKYSRQKVLPFWITLPSTAPRGFISTCHAEIKRADHGAMAKQCYREVFAFLKKVESQIEIARDVLSALKLAKREGWHLTVYKNGNVRIAFQLKRNAQIQTIILGELGKGALTEEVNDCTEIDQFSGAVVQFVRNSKQIKGYGATAFFLKGGNDRSLVLSKIGAILKGELVWRGRYHTEDVPSCLVHYEETCPGCQKMFQRVPYTLVGHATLPATVSTQALPTEERESKSIDYLNTVIEHVEKREGFQIGRFLKPPYYYDKAYQMCPHCASKFLGSLIDAETAKMWPYSKVDFLTRLEVPGRGWERQTKARKRSIPPVSAWDKLLQKRRDARTTELRRKEAEEEKRRRQFEASVEKLRVEREERQRKAEEARQIAAEKEAARRAEAAEHARQQAELEQRRRAVEDRQRLLRKARTYLRDDERAHLWMNSSHPRLGNRKPVEVCIESDASMALCESLLGKPFRR